MLTKQLEEKLFDAVSQIDGVSLLDGAMGSCVSLFVLGKLEKNTVHKEHAENILERVLSELQHVNCLELEKGITGIALGLSFLIKEKYVEGDVNEVLEMVDSFIYKGMFLQTDRHHKFTMIDVFIYWLFRYRETVSPIKKVFLRKVLIKSFNSIYINRDDSFYKEPLPFCLRYNVCLYIFGLIALYKMDIEQARVSRILSELKYSLFAYHPIMHSNKLVLMATATLVCSVLDDKEWAAFASQLRGEIDLQYIFTEEMGDKNISAWTGIVAFYFTISFFNSISKDDPIDIESVDFQNKIVHSSFWDRMEQDKDFLLEHFSLNGFCGIELFLKCILKN